MLLDFDQLPLLQQADPILHRTHSDPQLLAHLVHGRPALTTTTGTTHQVGIDLERIHIY